MSIIGLSLALLLPAVQQVRNAATKVACASPLQQLALAVHLYSDTRNHLPRGCDYPFLRDSSPGNSYAGLSWQTSVLPYVEHEALWGKAWDAHQGDPVGVSLPHGAVMVHSVAIFLCPSESRRQGGFGNGVAWGLTSYQGVAGTNHRLNDGIFYPGFSIRFADVVDGTSTTLMIGERPPGPKGIYGGWYAGWGPLACPLGPILSAGHSEAWVPSKGQGCRLTLNPFRAGQVDNACDVNQFWSLHSGGAHFAFADGSVRFLRYGQAAVLPLLATRVDGEVLSLE